MKSKNLKSAIWLTLVAGATAMAAQGVPGPGSGGGGGNKPPTEAGFNLSVPAIIAGGPSKFAITCPVDGWSTLTVPSKAPVYYPAACALTHDGEVCVDAGDYFVQRDAVWQAPCTELGSVTNTIGAWGDNLGGEAMLKVGSPIRVELVLWDSSGASLGKQGYEVIKLEPAELDRLSDYGHLAVDHGNGPEATPTNVGAVVHDPDATLKIERVVDGFVVYEGTAGAEINATGKIVYGHNLRVAEPGMYLITYTLPNVTFQGCEAGDPDTAICAGSEASIQIEVVGGGGGGGGKGGGQGGGKPIKPGKPGK
jgi:hypothetical protein